MSADILVVTGDTIEVVETAGGIELLEVGIQGPAGPAGSGSGGVVVVEFAFGDASPVTLTTAGAGKNVMLAAINIEIAFDGAGAALSIGPAGSPQQLLAQAQNNPADVARYEAHPSVSYGSATPLQLFIAPGSGASAGKGQVILQIEP